MPNIEIYGYEGDDLGKLIAEIQSAFHGKTYQSDYVITVMRQTYVIDHRGKRQPFIRLVSTQNDHNNEILEILRGLTVDLEGVDVEYAILENFFPKPS